VNVVLNFSTYQWLCLLIAIESQNNQVYRDARRIYKGGTPEFDLEVSSLIQFLGNTVGISNSVKYINSYY
jgi:hypothetical protein